MKEESISGIFPEPDELTKQRDCLEKYRKTLVENLNNLQEESFRVSKELTEINIKISHLKYFKITSKYLITDYKNGNKIFAKIDDSFNTLQLKYNIMYGDVIVLEEPFEVSIIKREIGNGEVSKFCVSEEKFYEELKKFLLTLSDQIPKKFKEWKS